MSDKTVEVGLYLHSTKQNGLGVVWSLNDAWYVDSGGRIVFFMPVTLSVSEGRTGNLTFPRNYMMRLTKAGWAIAGKNQRRTACDVLHAAMRNIVSEVSTTFRPEALAINDDLMGSAEEEVYCTLQKLDKMSD